MQVSFRQAYEALKAHEEPRADRRYLHLLKLAAGGSESAVSEAIGACLRARRVPLPDLIEKMLQRIAKRSVPAALSMEPLKPSLRLYDALLSGGVRS